ncbi:MAG: polyhydroxyalkanoate synthesis regulator DNA-binding domain-containing protein [Sandaracinaceae bacterium]
MVDSSDGARFIKRYANRKLYDTRESRYVTLEQIAAFVRDGDEIRVVDNSTKEDLTNATLAQIIYEQERKAGGPAPAEGARPVRALIQNQRERLLASLREAPMGRLIVRKGEEDPSHRLSSPKEVARELSRLADDRIKGLLGHAIERVQALQGEVGRLQARIEELETRLVQLHHERDEALGAVATDSGETKTTPESRARPSEGDYRAR